MDAEERFSRLMDGLGTSATELGDLIDEALRNGWDIQAIEVPQVLFNGYPIKFSKHVKQPTIIAK